PSRGRRLRCHEHRRQSGRRDLEPHRRRALAIPRLVAGALERCREHTLRGDAVALHPRRPARARMSSTAPEADVLILGGGVIGLACAPYLLAAGRTVGVIEQATVGAGASHGNCGTLTPSHAPPLAMPGMIGKALRMMLEADAPFHIKPRLD